MIIQETGRRSFFTTLLPLFVLAHFAHHLLTALPVPLLPFIRNEFDLDYTQSALVVSAFTLSYGIGQLPAGWLADRIGPRILITIGICGVALAGILVGLSQIFIMIIIFLVLMGVAGGGYHPAAAPLISASVETKKRGRALGFHMIGGSGSFFLAPIIAAAIAGAWGWRGSFIGMAVPTAAFGIIFYILLNRMGGVSQAQQVITNQLDETSPTPGHLRRLVAFMILTIFTIGVTFSIITLIPLFMVDHYSVSEETAARFLAIIYSAGLWAGPLGGYLSDRLGRVPLILAATLIAGLVIYLINLASYGFGIGAILLLLGITVYIRMPVAEAYIFGQTTGRHRSTTFGIYYFASMESGALFTPVLGYFIDNFGFYSSFTIASAATVAVTLLCSVFLWGSWD
ncbi:MAG: MFS transporter [Dehalococcoidia bacterium]|nr:MAG: MFS transporter [Dehalococcoidia bacterium]